MGIGTVVDTWVGWAGSLTRVAVGFRSTLVEVGGGPSCVGCGVCVFSTNRVGVCLTVGEVIDLGGIGIGVAARSVGACVGRVVGDARFVGEG